MKKTLILLAVLEAAYFVLSRFFIFYFRGDPVTKEILWTGIRVISFIAVFYCFRGRIFDDRKKDAGYKRMWPLVAGICILMSIPILVGELNLAYPLNYVYALTSIVIGFREEFVYRGVLQKVISDRFGIIIGLLISNLIFVFYHYGSLPFTASNVFEFFFAGTFMGLIYFQTNRIILVSILHFIYDVLWSFTPLMGKPLPEPANYILLVLAVLCLTFNMKKGRLLNL